MAYQISWFIEKRVLYCRYSDFINIEQLNQVVVKSRTYYETGIAPIHTILDFIHVQDLDFSFKAALNDPGAAEYFKNPKLGWTIYVAQKDSNFYHLVASFLEKQFEAKIAIVENLDMAHQFLIQKDKNLSTPSS